MTAMIKWNKDGRGSVYSLKQSFSFALNGIRITIIGERNFRIHTCVMIYVVLFSLFYDFSPVEYAVIALTFALVRGAEMMNTAIEEVINSEFEGYHIMAKKAKDIAAGAVFICAVTAVIVGVILFWDIPTMLKIFWFFFHNPLLLLLLAASGVVSVLFIMGKIRPFGKKDPRI